MSGGNTKTVVLLGRLLLLLLAAIDDHRGCVTSEQVVDVVPLQPTIVGGAEPHVVNGTIVNRYNPHKQIRIDVFEKYVPAIPIIDNRPLEVILNLQMVMLADVHEPEEAILLNCWMMVFWKDLSIQWNASVYNSTIAEFPSTTKLWVPDITWYERIPMVEAYESDAGLFSGARAVVRNDGEIYVSRGLLMKSHCALSIKFFPFDRQECNFTFSSNLHDTDRLILKAVEGRRESLTDSEGWTMLGFPSQSYNKTFRGVGKFARVVFTLKMKRKPLFFVFYLMLPSFLISVLSCFVFFLPPQSSEKIPFCVNILLSLTVFMMIMTDITPPSEEVPLLSVYFFTVLLLAVLTAAATIVIENVYDSGGMLSNLLVRFCIDHKRRAGYYVPVRASKFRFSPIRTQRAGSTQAANLAHHRDSAYTRSLENLNFLDTNNFNANGYGNYDRQLSGVCVKHGDEIIILSREDRVAAVKKLNRMCFAFFGTVTICAPLFCVVYGATAYTVMTREPRWI